MIQLQHGYVWRTVAQLNATTKVPPVSIQPKKRKCAQEMSVDQRRRAQEGLVLIQVSLQLYSSRSDGFSHPLRAPERVKRSGGRTAR